MIRSESQTIDGIVYTTRTFPATAAIVLGARLARIVGSASGAWRELLVVAPDKVEQALASPLVVLEGLLDAAQATDPEEFAALARDLLAQTECNDINGSGQPGPVGAHFDQHFAGRLMHLGRVAFWVARVGFGDG